jgi:UDPglucose--hexose-1-phosphate uridylyltransferase
MKTIPGRLQDLLGKPHRRRNPLTGEWLLVSPQRTMRPWQGSIESLRTKVPPRHDPACYLCPGNSRAGQERNPVYAETFVFTNDFSALLPGIPPGEMGKGGLLHARAEPGVCRVVCFTPRHDLTLAEMDVDGIRSVVDVWVQEFKRLRSIPGIGYVQIFENKGAMMGASNPHPHGQIWAQESVPAEPVKEGAGQLEHFTRTRSTLLSDYLALELESSERVVTFNEHFVGLVPFWAIWPYETMIISRRAVPDIAELTYGERVAFADIIRRITARYDNLFTAPFPYSAGIHQRPTDGAAHPEWHLHMHFYPPLLRSASVRKFMVGYEMFGAPQRDITPEVSAAKLREQSEIHFSADERKAP